MHVDDTEFDVSDLRNFKTVGMFFQTGYLTTKDYGEATGFYYLDVPDKEIARDVALLTMDSMSRSGGEGASWATRPGDSLRSFELDEFFAGLDALYAKICYGDSREMVASEAREVERLA